MISNILESNTKTYIVFPQDEGLRLDIFLKNSNPNLTRSHLKKLIDRQKVKLNTMSPKAGARLKAGDRIELQMLPPKPMAAMPEPIPLTIVFEDDMILVINKPSGLVVHPAAGNYSGTLVNGLLYHCQSLPHQGSPLRPGIVHRLDQDTSGLILVAKSERIQRLLQRQFKERTVYKAYLALLDGHLRPAWGRIEAPIGRDPHHRQRMAVLSGGREAITEYHVLEQFSRSTGQAAGDYSLVQAEPKTGRTHQIRVHFASIKHPVVGDAVYGRRRSSLPVPRQFLHARQLVFKHPRTGQRMELEAPLPPDLAGTLELLRA